MSDFYALLIGIDYYYPNRLPDGGSYPSLGGCVRDIGHVEDFLTKRLEIPEENVTKLTASNAVGGPPEPAQQRPTYGNMVVGFKQLCQRAQPGDQVYIHYSGHGGRATTAYEQVKQGSGLDEVLVPTDIGNSDARYLRDVELAYLLKQMVEKELLLTVVLDSCHSGGATRGAMRGLAPRGGGARPRGISSIDTTARPTDSLVASIDELTAAWQASTPAMPATRVLRAVKPASGWLLEPKGYTLLTACRASELANEYPFDGSQYNGALTYWLLDSLRQAGPGSTYKMLHDRILSKVHSQFVTQTPQLQGEGDRIVFAGEQMKSFFAVPVMQIDRPGNRIQLNAGQAQGVNKGDQFAVFPHGHTDFGDPDSRIALSTVDEPGAVISWATIDEQFGDTSIEQGAQAVLVHSANVRLARNVAVVIEDTQLRQKLEKQVEELGQGFLSLTAGPVDFQVADNDHGEYEIWDASGEMIPNVRPALRMSDDRAITRLVGRLIHLSKYRSVQELDVPDAAMREKLRVELITDDDVDSDGGTPVYKPGERTELKITNRQLPGEPNDPRLILNICVLCLQNDWSVTQVYPSGAAYFEPLDPGKSISIPFEAYLPEGHLASLDILKVFATRGSTNFRWLELPSLDQPPRRSRSVALVGDDPLEQMFSQLTGEQAATRALKLTSAPQAQAWTVWQVELRVEA